MTAEQIEQNAKRSSWRFYFNPTKVMLIFRATKVKDHVL